MFKNGSAWVPFYQFYLLNMYLRGHLSALFNLKLSNNLKKIIQKNCYFQSFMLLFILQSAHLIRWQVK